MKPTVDVVLPPGPRCRRCGHVMCPCCETWCDTLTDDGLCCDGQCDVDPLGVAIWAKQREQVAPYDDTVGKLVAVAEGPFQWS